MTRDRVAQEMLAHVRHSAVCNSMKDTDQEMCTRNAMCTSMAFQHILCSHYKNCKFTSNTKQFHEVQNKIDSISKSSNCHILLSVLQLLKCTIKCTSDLSNLYFLFFVLQMFACISHGNTHDTAYLYHSITWQLLFGQLQALQYTWKCSSQHAISYHSEW